MRANYLNITDATLEDFVDVDDFEESVLLNVLFMDRTVIHESNFFNSRNIAKHIEKRPGYTSLFELAAREGLIIPSFRDPRIGSLEQALRVMRSEDIYGENWMKEEMKSEMSTMTRIIDAVDHGMKRNAPMYWPTDVSVGGSYSDLLHKYLQTEQPPAIDGIDVVHSDFLERVWGPTKAWRMDCIEEARINTSKKGGQGVQRMEILSAIGRSLGHEIRNNGGLRQQFHSILTQDEERIRIDAFLRWLAQCHHLNMAKTLALSVNFPLYHIDEDFMLDSLMSTPNDAFASSSDSSFRIVVRFPSVTELMKYTPAEVIAIRNDLGLGYLTALRSWDEDPSQKNRQAVSDRLITYCEQLCARVESKGFTIEVEYSRDGRSQLKKLRDKGVETALGAIPVVGKFVSFANLALTTYRYAKQSNAMRAGRAATRTIELSILPPEQN